MRTRSWVAVGILLVFALFLRINIRQGKVQGPSMEPTYHSGDTVIVWKSAPRKNLKPGTVIVFRDKNGDELIKRIAFIRPVWIPHSPPGFYRNINGGRLIPYSILFDSYFQNVARHKWPRQSPENTIYVLGDNLLESDDSRHIGPISPRQILGKVIP